MHEQLFLVKALVIVFCTVSQVTSDCINVRKCPAAVKYINDLQNKAIHNSSLQILKEAFCGTLGTETRVFCEKIPSCYEPTDENFCVKFKDCCVARRLVTLNATRNLEAKAMIRQSQCVSNDSEIKVKCGSLLKVEEMVMKQMLAIEDDSVCITPSGLKGRCIALESCRTFNGKPVTQNYLDYLDRSVCGIKNEKVCCGVNDRVDDVCGVDTSAGTKIAGGMPTEKNEFPWVVVLQYTEPEIVCGGNLINSQFVLTAAHCVRPDLKNIRIGGNLNNSQRTDFLEFDIIKTKLHPNYKRRPLKFDIALLKIQTVTYQANIKWICLPPLANSLPSDFIVVGNGNTENDTLSKLQLKALIPYAETSRCEKLYRNYLDNYYDFIICAGGVPGIDTCPGDSGGPLMSKGNTSVWQLYGIVSGGSGTCVDGIPGFYTRVDKFLNWINANMIDML